MICGVRVPQHVKAFSQHSDGGTSDSTRWSTKFSAARGTAIYRFDFPPSDPTWNGAAYEKFPEIRPSIGSPRRWELAFDVTADCERPKVARCEIPGRPRMQRSQGCDCARVGGEADQQGTAWITGREDASKIVATATHSLLER